MRQYKLDLVEPLTAAPVFNRSGPAMARIAESVDEDDGRRVPGRGREEEGSSGD